MNILLNDSYDCCNVTSFNVKYRQFNRNCPKVTDNIKNFEKSYTDVVFT